MRLKHKKIGSVKFLNRTSQILLRGNHGRSPPRRSSPRGRAVRRKQQGKLLFSIGGSPSQMPFDEVEMISTEAKILESCPPSPAPVSSPKGTGRNCDSAGITCSWKLSVGQFRDTGNTSSSQPGDAHAAGATAPRSVFGVYWFKNTGYPARHPKKRVSQKAKSGPV